MDLYLFILTFLLAYLLGAIPTSVWVGLGIFKVDVRLSGSKNAGATNTFRVLGAKAGIPVLLFDVFKGFGAVYLSLLSSYIDHNTDAFVYYRIGLGLIAVIGHIFPVYIKFRGGKGVATLLGVFIALLPYPALCALGVFVIVLLVSRYVSLSSMLAALSFPLFSILVFAERNVAMMVVSLLVFVLIVITHRKNIGRLIKGEENRANLFGKKTA